MGQTTRQVGQAMFWSVLAKIGRFFLALASSVIIVRALGAHDYGVLSLVRVVLIFVGIIAGAGLGQSLLKYLPVLKLAGDREGARVLVRRVITVQTAVWAVFVVLSYLCSDWFEAVFQFEGVGKILWIAVGLWFFDIAFKFVTQILNSYYDTKLLSAANVVGHAVFIVALLTLLPMGYGIVGVFLAAAVGNLTSTLMVVRRVHSNINTERPQTGSGGIDRKRLLRFSLPLAIIGVLNIIVWRQSETLFLAHFRSAAEAGFFDLAYRLPQTALEFIPGTLWPIIMAGVSEVYAKNEADLNKAIDRYYRMLFLLSAPLCVVGATLGGRAIPILYGESMAPAAVPTQVFFLIFTLSFLGTPLSMALYVIEKSHVNLLIYIVLAIINVGLDLVLIPRYGVIGAIIPVGLVISLSPLIYRMALSRYVSGTRVPYGFIAKCFLVSSPVALMLPFTDLIRGVPELCAALLGAAGVIVVMAKKLRLVGERELDMLGAVPGPVAKKLLDFVSS